MIKEWVNKTREYNGNTQSYLHWDVHKSTYSELIDLYIKYVAFMAEHTFTATWKLLSVQTGKKKNLEGDVLIVNDFAQNYLCLHLKSNASKHVSFDTEIVKDDKDVHCSDAPPVADKDSVDVWPSCEMWWWQWR